MRFRETRHGRTVVLVPEGDMDATALSAFGARVDALLRQGTTALVVDLGGVTLLPSTAVGFLLEAVRRFREVGGAVVLARVGRHARGTLATLGLLPVLTLHETVEAAIGALERRSPGA